MRDCGARVGADGRPRDGREGGRRCPDPDGRERGRRWPARNGRERGRRWPARNGRESGRRRSARDGRESGRPMGRPPRARDCAIATARAVAREPCEARWVKRCPGRIAGCPGTRGKRGAVLDLRQKTRKAAPTRCGARVAQRGVGRSVRCPEGARGGRRRMGCQIGTSGGQQLANAS